MNLKNAKILSKKEQKSINGGANGSCCLSWNHTGFSDCGYSVAEAQWKYNSEWTPTSGGGTVTGYCCASCPQK